MHGFLAIFIEPLEALIRFFLESAYSLTQSYGFSIIVVSAVVSAGVLPLYALAESWQNKERELQNKLQPILAEFKTVYKGWQLHAFTQTLYRQNRYHPIYALRAYVGIAIQIPFFLAAYRLLSGYGAFNGQSFGFIRDLGQPDQILKFGDVSLNLLPILMTVVNLFSSYIYGKKLSRRENLQLLGLALFFLVVLYRSPSGLLLYWTCNNIFTLLRNFAQRWLDRRKNPQVTEEHPLSWTSIRQWASQQRTNFSRLRLNQLFKPDEVWSVYLGFTLVTCLAVFLFSPLALIASGSPKDFSGDLQPMLLVSELAALISFLLATVVFAVTRGRVRQVLALASILFSSCILISIFLFPPDYGDMSNLRYMGDVLVSPASKWLSISAFSVIAVFVIALLADGKSKIFTTLWPLLTASIIVICFSHARSYHALRSGQVVEDSATLVQDFRFSRTHKNVLVVVLDRFIGGFVPKIMEDLPELKNEFDGFTWYSHSLSPSDRTMGGIPGIMGGWEYTIRNINLNRPELTLRTKIQETPSIMPFNFKKIGWDTSLFSLAPLSFSNLGEKRYLQDTQIKNIIGNYTNLWLQERYGVKYFLGKVDRLLFSFAVFRAMPPSLRLWFYLDGRWRWRIGVDQNIGSRMDKSARQDPEFVYGNFTNDTERKQAFDNWSTLYFLPRLSKVDETIAQGSFLFFHSDFPHEPYSTGIHLEPEIKMPIAYPRQRFREFQEHWETITHFYTDEAALKVLVPWFHWMKENGVYDNTRIIFVSDHGWDVLSPLFQSHGVDKKVISLAHFNNLFMVKDFAERGPLKISSEFRAAPDVPTVAMKGLVEGTNPFTQSKIEEPREKFPFYSYHIEWRPTRQYEDRYSVFEGFRVKNEDIYNLNNWENIQDSSTEHTR
jgi:YidC/Oxa1 family membrane protein insertase